LVFDAWALLAFIQGEEPAASRVMQLIGQAEQKRVQLVMSWIKLGEVYYNIGRQKGLDEARETLDEILLLATIGLHDVKKRDILAAAENKMNFAMSYADAFAIALTQSLNATIVTGDPEIIGLDDAIRVEKLERGKINVVPLPFSESTQAFPPWFFTILSTVASLKPVPSLSV
jgi:predicted nucleic acid-binding protein